MPAVRLRQLGCQTLMITIYRIFWIMRMLSPWSIRSATCGYTEPQTTKFAKDNGILVEAYSPLATGGILENLDIKKIADKYGVSVAQLALRFVLQNGVLPLPKATHEAHIADNTKLDFEISEADMDILNHLTSTDI